MHTNKLRGKESSLIEKVTKKKAFIYGLWTIVCGLFLLGMASAPEPRVCVKKLKNNHYQLIVEGRPFIVKGACYNPTPIGRSHDYDFWSDQNKPWIKDGGLMRDMGINTIRIYQAGQDPEAVKTVISDLYELYGIRTIMGHWLGFWEYPCPLYDDKAFQERVKAEVLEMVNLYKNEKGVLFWVLGNENNYSCIGRVRPWSSDEIDKEEDPRKRTDLRYKAYYSFVNELSKEIHKVDSNHPVALGNGELTGLEYANRFAPDIDLVACIIYRGKTFGNLFRSLKATFERPIVIAEFGADAYDAYLKKEDQNMQAFFLESQWRQIYDNLANNKDGAGNCLGGVMFEWTDEWWKYNESSPDSWELHDEKSNWSNGNYYFDIKAEDNKNMNEEWFGIVELSGEIEDGINRRLPRKAYYVVRDFWKGQER